ncbi:MAG: hypothetical protein ACYC0Q_05365 [Eubacteriales bacterium]
MNLPRWIFKALSFFSGRAPRLRMPSPRWVILNRKMVFVAGSLVALVLVVWGGSRLIFGGAAKLTPQQMLGMGVERAQASASFRYQAEVHYLKEEKAAVDLYSKVDGERVAPDRVRIQGTILNRPVEFVQIGDNAFFKDQVNGRWISLPGSRLVDSELFYAELNPLAFFNFKDIPEMKYTGAERVNGERLLAFEMRPNLIDPFLELLLTDYHYKVWLSPQDYRVRQATIRAGEKRNVKGTLTINLRIWDYDKNITIDPPL